MFFNRGRAVKIENTSRVPLTGGGDRIPILTENNRSKVTGRIKYLPRFVPEQKLPLLNDNGTPTIFI